MFAKVKVCNRIHSSLKILYVLSKSGWDSPNAHVVGFLHYITTGDRKFPFRHDYNRNLPLDVPLWHAFPSIKILTFE